MVASSHRLQEKMYTFPKGGLRYNTACVARILYLISLRTQVVVPRPDGRLVRMERRIWSKAGSIFGHAGLSMRRVPCTYTFENTEEKSRIPPKPLINKSQKTKEKKRKKERPEAANLETRELCSSVSDGSNAVYKIEYVEYFVHTVNDYDVFGQILFTRTETFTE